MDSARMSGYADADFGAVADTFRLNFCEHGDLGAAFAVYQDGRKVVDLWGGFANREEGAPWREDTLQVVFSGTKGLSAGCLLLLVDDALLDPQARVADYWPEFGARGKSQITVAEALSHRAGLPAIRARLTAEEILDSVGMSAVLTDQEPYWPDEERVAYHALTFGWLCDGLTRSIVGRSVGELFHERIAKPLDLEAWIGLPEQYEARVSRIDLADYEVVLEPRHDAEFAGLVYGNPPLFRSPLIWNERAFHASEIPAANGIATARSVAKFYACLACGGELDGERVWSSDAVTVARQERARGIDPFSGESCAFGLGFALQTEPMYFGPVPGAFGHCGAGGSAHGAWPQQRVGFSYCMNQMRDDETDQRARRLLASLANAIGV